MTWTLLVFFVIASNGFSADIRTLQIPMQSGEACTAAAANMQKDSKSDRNAFICISSNDGSVFRVKP